MKLEQKQKWLAAFDKHFSDRAYNSNTIQFQKKEHEKSYLAARQDAQGEIDKFKEGFSKLLLKKNKENYKLQAEIDNFTDDAEVLRDDIEKLQAENKLLRELCVDLWNGFEGVSEAEDERMNDRVEQCLKEIEEWA